MPPESEEEPKRPKQARAKESARPAKSIELHDPHETIPIRLTHPEKILDASSGLTKAELADYYRTIAPYMLPHIGDRPLTLVRCMEGSGKPCFFQKHKTETLPDEIESIDITDKKTGKPEPYITFSTDRALVSLAQISVLEIHSWGSKNDSLETPDRIVIDLDPDTAIDWRTLAQAADEVRRRFKALRLESFLKSTGGKGLHVVVPIQPEHDWPAIKAFAHKFVLEIEKDNPELYLTRMTKAMRKGKIYLDYLRNERGATSIAPYSPRARDGAHVAMPLDWPELKVRTPPIFSVSNLSRWKQRLANDPWDGIEEASQHLRL